MIRVENYPNAYKEVYVILKNIDKKDYDAVPQDFIAMLESNMNREYEFEVHSNEDFEKQELLQETKTILAYLYLNYWGTDEEKRIIKQKFKQDILKDEEKKREKYNTNEIFEKEPKKEENSIVEYKKENLFTKLVNKIKEFFTRK